MRKRTRASRRASQPPRPNTWVRCKCGEPGCPTRDLSLFNLGEIANQPGHLACICPNGALAVLHVEDAYEVES